VISFTAADVDRKRVKIPCGFCCSAIRSGLLPLDLRRSRAHLTVMAIAQSPSQRSLAAQVEAYAAAVAMVAVSTLVGLWIAPRWGTAAVDMIYLPAVLAAAVWWGLGPAVVAGISAALAYNFFFTTPVHTFRMDRVTDMVTVIILLIVALVTSKLASGMRSQAQLAAAHAARNATVAGFAGRLLPSSTEEQIAHTAGTELRRLFDCNAMLVTGLPQPRIVAAVPEDNRLTPSDIAAAALVLESGEAAGRGTNRLQPAEWVFYPIRSGDDVLAAAGLARDDGVPPVDDDGLPLLVNLLDQVALALVRARAEAEAREIASLRERDRLRSALLSSVGHDLRTPLTGIVAAAAELRRSEKDSALVATIEAEAGKLERYIANLLDMARIEAGAVKLKTEPVDLVDAVAAALKDVRPTLADHPVSVDLPDDLPLVRADAQLLHHCLINLIDNAARYSADKGTIRVAATGSRGEVRLTVEDEGPGLPLDAERALDAFTRIEGSDRRGGAGVGLAIVKAFAEAMGAKVTATNRDGGKGAIFALHFPETLVLKAAEHADAG
jgi:two-component system sensor histidine kinase KdpD